jgi:hypothetical protein
VLLGLLVSSASGCEGAPDVVQVGRGWPAWCEADGDLDVSCDGACVAGVIVDYLRLEPRGYWVHPLNESEPVDPWKAEAKAAGHIKQLSGHEPDLVDADKAGDFFNCFLRQSGELDSWLVVVHAKSGEVVFAGLEDWGETPLRGSDPPLPAGWQDAAPLGCSDGAADPESRALRTTGSPMGSAPASTAGEAWEVARRLDLVEQFTAGVPYRVMVVSYAAAIGEFDPKAADWLVWITRDP